MPLKIRHYVNGHWTGTASAHISALLASFHRQHDCEVHEMFEIGLLVIFTPEYRNAHISLN